jgi:extracellular elastinolytic metalloproteinase
MRVRFVLGVAVLVLIGALLPVVAAAAPVRGTGAGEPRPFFDTRVGATASAPARTAPGRAALKARLGRSGVLSVDPLTNTPRALLKTSGALTGPNAGSREAIARGYLRANAAGLGLSRADVDAMTLAKRVDAPGGVTILRYRQAYRGVPAFDNGARVALDRAGRVLGVTGSPQPDLAVDSLTPHISSAQARRALARSVGQDATGGGGKLTLFGAKGGPRLAWRVEFAPSSSEHYVGVVDARSGRLLWRANRVKRYSANVFDYYAGAPEGGDFTTVDLTTPGWLPADADTLEGPYSVAYPDENDNDVRDPSEVIAPESGDFQFPFTPFDNPTPAERCTPTHLCSWDPADRDSWRVNREQSTTQAFYLVSKFHDHLASPAIGFDAGDGNFEGDDPVDTQSLDGADSEGDGGPDFNHVNNANMNTPPDGQSPRMQLFLFEYSEATPYFDYNGDDAATVWHEYTHGLSNRLVVDESGEGALNSAHAGAMGEAWSDWYAEDLLVREGLETDSPDLSGEIDLGEPSDAIRHATRFSAIDCPVGQGSSDPESACPGGVSTGPGGFTLGDFGHVASGPEVHSDGEIWVQTLWDLRQQLVEELAGDAAGSDAAEEVITMGMRLAPPEPSMLDMRNAILQADTALNGGGLHDTIWSVFAHRGMGFYAAAFDGNDTKPAEDFNVPPADGTPTGGLRGTITDSLTGLPLAGVAVKIGDKVSDTTGADGTYELQGVTEGTYAKLAVRPTAGGYDAKDVTGVVVQGNQTTTRDIELDRNWASASGGASIAASNDTTGEPFCGPTALIDDQDGGVGWEAWNPNSPDYPAELTGDPPTVTIELPAPVSVSAIGIDPASTCFDGASATLKEYRLDVSANGTTFVPYAEGEFAPEEAGNLNRLEPPAGTPDRVTHVRLTMISPQNECDVCSGRDFIDVTALEVFGATDNKAPSGTLSAAPATVAVGAPVTFTAAFTDPDSQIAGYDWDFNGDNVVDRTTSGATVQHSYPQAGSVAAKVTARDVLGAKGVAGTTVTVTPPAAPPSGGGGGSSLSPLPVISIARKGSKGRLTVRVTCATRCTLAGKLTVTRTLARRLGLRRQTLRRIERTIRSTRRQTIRIRLPKSARKLKSVVVKARFTATLDDGRKRTVTRTVRVRR